MSSAGASGRGPARPPFPFRVTGGRAGSPEVIHLDSSPSPSPPPSPSSAAPPIAARLLALASDTVWTPPPVSEPLQSATYTPSLLDNVLWDLVRNAWARHREDVHGPRLSVQSGPYLSTVSSAAVQGACERLVRQLQTVPCTSPMFAQALFGIGMLHMVRRVLPWWIPSVAGAATLTIQQTQRSVREFVRRFGEETLVAVVPEERNAVCRGREMEYRIVYLAEQRGTGWLNDELVNTGVLMAATGASAVPMRVIVSHVWTSFVQHGRDLPRLRPLSARNVFVVVSLPDHWTCLYADYAAQTVQFLNSYPTDGETAEVQIRYFRMFLRRLYPDVAEWRRISRSGPHQANLADCGPWVIAHARSLAVDGSLALEHTYILGVRQWLADELVTRAITYHF